MESAECHPRRAAHAPTFAGDAGKDFYPWQGHDDASFGPGWKANGAGENRPARRPADRRVPAAMTEMAPKKRRKKSKLEVKVSPHFTVSLDGETAETLAGVRKNLRLANRILSGITRFFNG